MDKLYLNKQYIVKKVSFSNPEYTTFLYSKTEKTEKIIKTEKIKNKKVYYNFLTYPIIFYNLNKK